jgi:hypothetical protein
VKGAFCEQCGTPVSAAGTTAGSGAAAGAPPAMSPPPMSAPMAAAPGVPGAVAPVKKTSPLVWILLGVLGFIAICFVGCIVTVGYFARNPGIALAKLITAANPNAEVVSTDNGAQTITIRDKKTGEEVTMSFDDIKAGRFKMRAIGKNGEVANVEMGAGSGKVPSWLPTYPGATAQGNFTATGDDNTGRGAGGIVTYESSDSPQKVFDYYKTKLNTMGMKIESEASNGNTGSITAREEDEKRWINVTIGNGSSGGSSIGISFGEKK